MPQRIRALRAMGVDIPSLGNSPHMAPRYEKPSKERARIARIDPGTPEQRILLATQVLIDVATNGEKDQARVAAAAHLETSAKELVALSAPGKARTATEMLEAVERALPELRRRAALERGEVVPKSNDPEEPGW